VIDRIATGFAAPILCDDIPIDAFVGIGLRTTTASPDEDLRGALSAAQDSRGEATGWAWFDQRRDEAHRRAFRLLTDLKAALRSERELELHYQPKIALATGACQSVEALVRWTHPSLGPVSPGEFVPLAETTALVAPLTRWVIDAATRQMMIWQNEGLRMPVAINISPRNLEEADFVEYLVFNCAARGIDHSLVELEITEGVSAAHGPLLRDRLAALRKLGFGIAIDDFGAGYSNMAYLTRLSASTLKIDQSLVRGLEPNEQSGRLVAGIVQMGHDLGYKIVAEGVETATELDLLARWGCDIGQGWHFGRPMPAAAFRDWLAERG
jgi:EAL domain-containing protein (putative c-di-GMP-specific phosphodiesterase class I)